MTLALGRLSRHLRLKLSPHGPGSMHVVLDKCPVTDTLRVWHKTRVIQGAQTQAQLFSIAPLYHGGGFYSNSVEQDAKL